MKYRFDWNITNNTKAYVRIAHDNETANGARGVWWGASDVALPSPNVGTNHGRSLRQRGVGPQPDDDERGPRELEPADAGQHLRGSVDHAAGSYGLSMPGSFGNASPYIPGLIPNWGGGVSNMWSAANDMYAHNDELLFSDKLTKIMGAHGLKFGVSLDRLQKQQNFQNNEEGQLVFAPAWTSGGQTTGNAVGDMFSGYVTQYALGHAWSGRRIPLLEHGRVRPGLLEAEAQPDAGIRRAVRLLDEQPGAQRPRRILQPVAVPIRRSLSSWIRRPTGS